MLAALLVPAATAHAAPATDLAGRVSDRTVTLPVRDALAELPIHDEDRTGYERTAFKHWVDADKGGCNTRAEVLKAEAVTAPGQGASCRLSGGRWYSPYDDRNIAGPSGLDIDHLVPLAEVWDSGASAWPPAERQAYANDLGDERALIAVSAASNRSKRRDRSRLPWPAGRAGGPRGGLETTDAPWAGGWLTASDADWGLYVPVRRDPVTAAGALSERMERAAMATAVDIIRTRTGNAASSGASRTPEVPALRSGRTRRRPAVGNPHSPASGFQPP